MVPKAAAAAVIKPAFCCWKHAVMMTSYCRPAGLLLLYESTIMLTLSYLQGADRGGWGWGIHTQRISEGHYGTRWAHQRARKEEGWRPHEAERPACLWTVVLVEFVHTGSVCVHAGGPTVVVSV